MDTWVLKRSLKISINFINSPLTNRLDNALYVKRGCFVQIWKKLSIVFEKRIFFFEFFDVFSENISSVKLFYVTALFIHFVFLHIFAIAEERQNINSQVKLKYFV